MSLYVLDTDTLTILPTTPALATATSPGWSGFLSIAHVLGLGGLDNSSSSEGAIVHSLGASAPGPGDTSKKPFPAPAARLSRHGRAHLWPRLGLDRGIA